jgi:UDP-N-acetylglucosamine transferase subunit ALG13
MHSAAYKAPSSKRQEQHNTIPVPQPRGHVHTVCARRAANGAMPPTPPVLSTACATERSVFATVGSTSFDGLIRSLISLPSLDLLVAAGISSLTLQYGCGAPLPPAWTHGPLRVRAFRFCASLQDGLRAADVAVCHGGAGSVFEAVDAGCAVVAVPNRALMDDHQVQLVGALAEGGVVVEADASADGEVARAVARVLGECGEWGGARGDGRRRLDEVAPRNPLGIVRVVAGLLC